MYRLFYFFITCLIFLPLEGVQHKTVLVVGGAGYIGSHINEQLYNAGYQTIVLDNLCRGTTDAVHHGIFIKGDCANASLLDQIFDTYHVDAVMHFAALKDVGESMKDPLKYYTNNVASTLVLLDAMLRHNVKLFIFSSSAAIFGPPVTDLIGEEHPFMPINSYGKSKLMIETVLEDMDRAYNFRFISLRYFNAAGGDPLGKIKNTQGRENNLIPIILRSLQKPDGVVTIFGTDHATPDGTCIRDYIHIEDLGSAHIAAMEKLLGGGSSKFYNLGTGKGFSVKEVIQTVEKVTKRKVNVVEAGKREGDPAILIASSEKAQKELQWKPRYTSLETMVEHAWKAMW